MTPWVAKRWQALLKLRQGTVARIGFHPRYQIATPGIPFPDQLGITPEGLRRGQVLRIVLRP